MVLRISFFYLLNLFGLKVVPKLDFIIRNTLLSICVICVCIEMRKKKF